jgi:hypothetical protein
LIINVVIYYSILHYVVINDKSNDEVDLAFITFSIILTILTLSTEAFMIRKAESLMAQIKLTSRWVNKMLVTHYEDDLHDIVELFYRKILHRDRVVQSCFFKIDWMLMFSVIYFLSLDNSEVFSSSVIFRS